MITRPEGFSESLSGTKTTRLAVMEIHLYPLFLPNLGLPELSIVFLIILLLFGPGKLPDVCRALGDGFKQFKKASTTEEPSAAIEAGSDKSANKE